MLLVLPGCIMLTYFDTLATCAAESRNFAEAVLAGAISLELACLLIACPLHPPLAG